MTSKTIIKMTVAFSLFILISIFSNGSCNTVSGQQCENNAATNEAIVKSIYDKINANKNLAPQISHINITSTNLAIKIQGYADNKSDYDKIVDYAMDTECALKLNVNQFDDKKPEALMLGCSNGTKQCGDICIPDNDVCNIKGGF